MIELNDIKIGDNSPFVLIAGPCVVENAEIAFEVAEEVQRICNELKISYIYKSSYKKANRTNISSFTTIGVEKALTILNDIKVKYNLPILTDVHSIEDVAVAKEVADVLQIPAFLCRQTDLLFAAGEAGKIVNIKKGQFLSPEDMKHAADKVAASGNNKILLTERGTTFGYHNLVVDMRGLIIMRNLGYPVVMDATHSVQLPSNSNVTGGNPEFIFPLAKAATAVGIDALFLEVHPEPSKALSDAGSQLKLEKLKDILKTVQLIDKIVKNY